MSTSICSALLACAFAVFANAIVLHHQRDFYPEYDYIVVGGGVSGLVVANRLTENRNTTVLVLEAGRIDNCSQDIQYPRFAQTGYVNHIWPITSLPTPGLNNRTYDTAVAQILGGGSAINGMAFQRGAPGDYGIWAELIGDPGWGWEGLLPYFKKSETFTPPLEEQHVENGITFDIDTHGTSGPVQASFPPYITSLGNVFFNGLRHLGIHVQVDGAANALGGFWSPNNLDLANRERSYARAYHEIANPRPNYHVLPETLVTRITPDLTRVEYITPYNPALTTQEARKTVRARKEIIMAAGAVHTPKILELSGIGSADILRSLGIDQVIDLPGVGENLQDHPTVFGSLAFTNLSDPTQDPGYINTNQTYDALMGELYEFNRTGPWTVGTENTLSFLTAGHLDFPVSRFRKEYSSKVYSRPGLDPSIIKGYEEAKALILNSMAESKIALTENLYVGIVSLQKPLSRGSVHAVSRDPYDMPAVDYRAFSHPLDAQILAHSLRFMADILPQTPAFREIGTVSEFPVPGSSDAQLADIIREASVPSFMHPVGTCAILKREDGGCVDSHLTLYGSNGRIRVVDASVFPVIPSAHTQATVYAVAERAAELIKRTVHT